MQYQHQLQQEIDDLPVFGAEVQRAHAPCCFVMHIYNTASLCTCTMLLHYAHAPEKETQ
jgi:hypothetical protein